MPEDAAARPASQLTVVTSTEGGTPIVSCSGKLVAGSVAVLQNEVRSLLPGAERIVLDLTDLGYMDSTGLGVIIGLNVSAKSVGARLELHNVNPRVRQLFVITKVESLFEVIT